MVKTKNERRERNGKWILGIALIGLVCLLYLGLQPSVAPDAAISSDQVEVIEVSGEAMGRDSFAMAMDQLGELLSHRINVFTGGEQKDGAHHVAGITFSAVDSVTIDYEVDYLTDWKKTDEWKGVAKIDLEKARLAPHVLTDRQGRQRPAFLFVDQKGKNEIWISISREDNWTSAIARVYWVSMAGNEAITPILYYK